MSPGNPRLAKPVNPICINPRRLNGPEHEKIEEVSVGEDISVRRVVRQGDYL